SLASAPDTATLGKAASHEELREGLRQAPGGKINGGGMATLRGLAVFTALESRGDRSPFHLLGALPHKGSAPILFTGRAEAPSTSAKAGAATGTFHLGRSVIEDIVKLVFTAR